MSWRETGVRCCFRRTDKFELDLNASGFAEKVLFNYQVEGLMSFASRHEPLFLY